MTWGEPQEMSMFSLGVNGGFNGNGKLHIRESRVDNCTLLSVTSLSGSVSASLVAVPMSSRLRLCGWLHA